MLNTKQTKLMLKQREIERLELELEKLKADKRDRISNVDTLLRELGIASL
jgi:hypothetical protein